MPDPNKTKSEHEIDEELNDTFPASDAPSWTLGLENEKGSMKVMRVHAYGGPEALVYENVPVPEIGKGQVLVRVHAASVNPIDCKLASGALRPVMNNKRVDLPWVPGADFSGTVQAVGGGVKDIQEGQAVYGNCPGGGAYAQWVAAQAATMAIKPRNLTFIEAAAVPIAAQTAWQALFVHGHLQEGQSVLIHGGSGGVGSFAVQLARWKKAHVVATGATDHLEFLSALGAHQAVDYKKTLFDSVVHGMDLVIDLIGGQIQERSLKTLKGGGCLVSTVDPPSQTLAQQYKVQALMMTMKPSREDLDQLTGLLESGSIKAHVTKTYPLAQAQEAWKQILSRHTKGKIVLIFFSQ